MSCVSRLNVCLFLKGDLCLKDFSKSLTDRAYTSYANLKPSTICDWGDIMSLLNAKFYLVELGHIYIQ